MSILAAIKKPFEEEYQLGPEADAINRGIDNFLDGLETANGLGKAVLGMGYLFNGVNIERTINRAAESGYGTMETFLLAGSCTLTVALTWAIFSNGAGYRKNADIIKEQGFTPETLKPGERLRNSALYAKRHGMEKELEDAIRAKFNSVKKNYST